MHKKILLALLIAAACGSAQADPEFKVSGFGTLGVTHSDNHDADYKIGFMGSGVGNTRSTDFGLDTMAAVQLDGKIDSHWSAVVQIVSARNPDDDFTPHVEWANIKYAFSPDFSIRLGRVGLPAFMVSDTRLVGYANPWVRGPVEVYNHVPTSNTDGLDMSYRLPVGDAALTFQGVLSTSTFKYPTPDAVETGKGKKSRTLVVLYENGPLSLRFGSTRSKVDVLPGSLTPLVSGLQTLAGFGLPGVSPAAAGVMNGLLAREGTTSFTGVGATYDSGKFLLQGEYTQRRNLDNKGLSVDVDGAYILGGIRFGNLTPYAICSVDKAKGPFTDGNVDILAASAIPQIAALGSVIQANFLTANKVSQRTMALGVRYDFMKNMDIKVQFDHVRPDKGGVGGSTPLSVNKTNLLTLNLDFVF